MTEMKVILTARAGCWSHAVYVDGELFVSRNHHCFVDAAAALKQALADTQDMVRSNQREAAKK
jgi:hypothetical protein